MRLIIFFLLFGFISEASADPILVGIHYGQDYLRATVSIKKGSYAVAENGRNLFVIKEGQTVDITASAGKVNAFFNGENYAGNNRLHFYSLSNSTFHLHPAGHKINGRNYEENLIAFAYKGRLQLVNEIELENYAAGVIEAESGKGQELEYYKVQSVISRTYALNNLVRHQQEGFQLCDATHCQVYHGRPLSEPYAALAAAATKDIVIVDADIRLITAAFHSNCGGKTVNAQDVWSKPLSYCVSKPDTFCLDMPHSSWEKTITAERWNNYLVSKRFDYTITNMGLNSPETIRDRQFYVVDSTLRIPTRVMRADLKLRSTHFNLTRNGDDILFIGQGFGHGVGLCQEGAMKMALLDYCYEDIIHFYYKDVHLLPRYMMWFFQE